MNQLGPHAGSIAEGMRQVYLGLRPHQLAMYHGITRENALKVHAMPFDKNGQKNFPQSWIFQYVFCKGGNKSGKTYTDTVRELASKLFFPGHVSMIVRKRKEQLRNTYMADFKALVDTVTGGNPDWLILDDKEEDGSVELTIRSVGKPSRAIYRIEPDGTPEFSADSFKGYHLNSFTAEEASQLRWLSIQKMQINLDQDNYPKRGTLITNPTREGTEIAKRFARYQRELGSDIKPEMLALTVDMRENTALTPLYFEEIKNQYKDDPIGFDMVVRGLDGIERKGKPVFEGFFNHDMHVRADIKFDFELPLTRCWDFGHGVAACGFWQKTRSGQMYKLAECIVENSHVEAFADDVNSFTKGHFPFIPNGIFDCGDVAGLQEKDTGQSIRIINKKLGIQMRTKAFGNIDPGLNHMRKLLSELRDGLPRLSYHPRCTETILGMKFGYHFKEQRDGRINAKPEKDGWYEHPIDADRYGICHQLPMERESDYEDNQKFYVAKGIIDIRQARAEKTLQDWIREGRPDLKASKKEG